MRHHLRHCTTLALLLLAAPGLAFAGAAEWASQVKIYRDEWGVPHIDGPTDASVGFGSVYAQCEDYFWQVEQTYIECMGRLSEVVGEAGLDTDMQMALFEIVPRAIEDYEKLAPDTKAMCDAASAGYNYFLEKNPLVKPRLLTKLEPWAFLAWERGLMLQRLLGQAHAPSNKLKTMLESEVKAATGSNAWAVGPEKTKNGTAMLFANPHQPWYGTGSWTEVHVRSGEGLHMSGATFPGGPIPSMGHNEYLGWAYTVNEPDIGDVYRLTFDHPTDKLKYKYGEGYKDATEWKATIKVKGKDGALEAREYTFRKSHYGPIMAKEDDTHYLAVKIAKLFEGSRMVQTMAMIKSKNFDEWSAAFGMLNLQMFNTVYADVDGNIFYIYNGTVAKKDPSVDWEKPVDGGDPKNEWGDFHTMAELPQALNPASGYVQSCNATPFLATDDGNPSKTDFPPYMVEDKDDDKRRSKISRYLLRGADDLTFEDWSKLAYDTTMYWPMTELPRYAKEHKALEARNPELAAKVKPYLDHLLDWDYKSTAASTQAELCVEWYEQLYGRGYPVETLKKEFQDNPDARFEALIAAADGLKKRFGDWKVPYGDVHRLQRFADHAGPATVPFNDTLPSLPQVGVPGPLGVAFTVYHTPSTPMPNRKKEYAVVGASFMGVYEFGEKIKAGSFLHYGQSGDPKSPHFFDQAELMSKQQFKPAWFYWDDVERQAVSVYHPGEQHKE